jgi:predicted RNase H-like HicB family nuclease
VIQVDFHGKKEVPAGTLLKILGYGAQRIGSRSVRAACPSALRSRRPRDPHFYGVTVPDILGCTTTGRSIEQAIANAREAIALHLEYLAAEGLAIPQPRQPIEIRIIRRSIDAAA